MAKGYDPGKATERQIRKAQASVTDYIDGVQGVTESPTLQASRKKEKMRAGINAALDSGKWEDGLLSVTLDSWKASTVKKGGERYASGIADSEEKTRAFHEEFSSFVGSVQDKVRQMPDTTLDQRLQRMMENARAMSRFKRTRRRK